MKEIFKKIIKFIKNDRIPDPPYTYDYIMSIPEELYAEHLKKMYKYDTGKKLNLKNPKTLNEKIQWLKINDNLPIKTQLADKVKVRDWVKEKIGEEYLKPMLWHGENFDDIPWDKLPNSFYLKANHGWKWQVWIRDKNKLLNNKQLFEIVKYKCNKWLSQSFYGFSMLELQYKNIVPQLLIESVINEEESDRPLDIEIYCFNGQPEIIREIKYIGYDTKLNVYNKNFENITSYAHPDVNNKLEEINETLKNAFSLSSKLCKDFKLVRVDWLYGNNKLYFNEMTFTPKSGKIELNNIEYEKDLSNKLKI